MSYYLNLNALEKKFYIDSMIFNRELRAKYDEMKLKSIFGEGKK
ncbi:hypothetical protein [Clostridium botulinum]|nr:hypothetical protein [Clostridium botulinum]EPS56484.1 hypothetical protein CLQ_02161 [Clostridium botulinum Af84]